MAKIQFGDLIVGMRGSSGGSTYSSNAAGAFRRNKVKPTNPNTNAQQTVKARVSALSQAWRALTDAQRAAWASATANFPYQDSLGQTKYYTAQQLFMTLNSSIRAAIPTSTLISSPPTPATVTQVVTGVLTATDTAGVTTALSLAYSPTVPAGHNVIVYATPPLSPGIMRPSPSLFRQVQVQAAAAASPANILTNYLAIQGNAPLGAKIWVKTTTVLLATGQRVGGGQTSAVVGGT